MKYLKINLEIKTENEGEYNRFAKILRKIKVDLRVGDVVTLPRGFTYGRRRFIIDKRFVDGSFQLVFLGGKEKGMPIVRFDWWELKKLSGAKKDATN